MGIGGWRESRRDERREFEADAVYETWRRGLDPDRMDMDRVSNDYYDGRDAGAEASRLARADYERRCQQEQEEVERAEQEYYEALEREEGGA